MINRSQFQKPSFSSIAFKGGFKFAFIGLFLIIIIGIAGASLLSMLSPVSYKGASNEANFNMEVKDTTVQPVKISVSHTFPISQSGGGYTVTEGPDSLDYNFTITSKDGNVVVQKVDVFYTPLFIKVRSDATTYVTSYDTTIDLQPGEYSVTLESSHPVDYTITQNSKYEGGVTGLVALTVLGIIILIGLCIVVLKKRNAMHISAQIAVLSGSPQSQYVAQGQTTERPPEITLGSPSSPQVNQSSSLYSVPGGTEVAYVCSACGNNIMNPPVQGIITCEKCGEKGRVY